MPSPQRRWPAGAAAAVSAAWAHAWRRPPCSASAPTRACAAAGVHACLACIQHSPLHSTASLHRSSRVMLAPNRRCAAAAAAMQCSACARARAPAQLRSSRNPTPHSCKHPRLPPTHLQHQCDGRLARLLEQRASQLAPSDMYLPPQWRPVTLTHPVTLYKVVAAAGGRFVSVFDGAVAYPPGQWVHARHAGGCGGGAWPPLWSCMHCCETPEQMFMCGALCVGQGGGDCSARQMQQHALVAWLRLHAPWKA